ncbi:helix-turn-helix domain-containing protein [Rhodococcus sp. NM-2]|uniref:helix-turn-helix domain-containing protein n=1 Tax=Rhodococcus sp. NM-2 TaxID=3401174 RepID=UPI003AAA9BC3
MARYARLPRMSRRTLDGFVPSRLSQARIDKHLAQGELALRADVSTATISAWEVGRSTPQVDRLMRVVEILGLRMDEVIDVPVEERKLGTLRELTGRTQAQLAGVIGVSTSLLAALERGHAKLGDAVAERLAGELGVSVTEIRAAYERGRARPPLD